MRRRLSEAYSIYSEAYIRLSLDGDIQYITNGDLAKDRVVVKNRLCTVYFLQRLYPSRSLR